MTVSFKLVSEFITIGTRPFEFVDPAIVNPVSATPLVMGEWLELEGYKMKRGSATPAVGPSFAYFAEQGAYDVQGLGKGPFLYLHQYEADTLVMDATDLAEGSPLEVATMTYGGIAGRRGLRLKTTGFVVGYVSRLPINNGGYLRFRRVPC